MYPSDAWQSRTRLSDVLHLAVFFWQSVELKCVSFGVISMRSKHAGCRGMIQRSLVFSWS